MEHYLYSAAQEVVNKGGICIVSKLPYDNASKDNFTAVRYELHTSLITDPNDMYVRDMSSIDPSLTSYMSIDKNGMSCTVSLD